MAREKAFARKRGKKKANGSGSDPRQRKDGRWECRATLDTPTGRRRVSFYGATSGEANRAKFEALSGQAGGKLFSDPQRLTVAEYLKRWLAETKKYEVAESTLGRYERNIRNHLEPFFGRLRLRDITPAHVRSLKARKLDEGCAPTTVGGIQQTLHAAMKQALVDGLIARDPCAGVKKAADRRKRPMRSLTEDEANALVKAAAGTKEEAIIVLALRTGMRQGELAALRWEDLDLEGSRPSISIERSADTRTRTVISPTKTGEDRILRLGPRTVDTLKKHLARRREQLMAAKEWHDPGWVFPNRKGKVRRRDALMIAFRKILADAGLHADIRFHDLRHTAGTLAFRQGRKLHEVSKMLGHADPSITLRVYAHVLEDMEDATAKAMDELF